MSSPVDCIALPCIHWGEETASNRALLVHGFQSCAATFVEIAEALSKTGWFVTACDLRGHGDAPRASSYLLEDYCADLLETVPTDGRSWDLVIAHSLGAACCTKVLDQKSTWALRFVMLDPYLKCEPVSMDVVERTMDACQAETVEQVSTAYPSWNRSVVNAKVWGQRRVDPEATKQTLTRNCFDLRLQAAKLTMPVLVIAGEPSKGSLFNGLGEQSPNVRCASLAGTGHNPHRDRLGDVVDCLVNWHEGVSCH